MAEVNKGPLSTILVYNDSTWRARDRGRRGGGLTTIPEVTQGSFSASMWTHKTFLLSRESFEKWQNGPQVTASGSRHNRRKLCRKRCEARVGPQLHWLMSPRAQRRNTEP